MTLHKTKLEKVLDGDYLYENYFNESNSFMLTNLLISHLNYEILQLYYPIMTYQFVSNLFNDILQSNTVLSTCSLTTGVLANILKRASCS